MYVNSILEMLSQSGQNGIFIDDNYLNVSGLLYADDLILNSDSVGHLNKLIKCLSEFCNKWCLAVNLNTTKIIVFRNGGIVRNNEIWYFNNNQIEVVTYYKYLGLNM